MDVAIWGVCVYKNCETQIKSDKIQVYEILTFSGRICVIKSLFSLFLYNTVNLDPIRFRICFRKRQKYSHGASKM
jgi:hypothetical protein